ncbi:hypothetical protein CKO28_05020 [Rhodovibrio sodomensis]|uniref:GmrSD restriction endonucleases C-terminal domain-containing protein n=1 Tax=Rhodovibrio sodomensis TaxID=1088 RepID=A0ABS1DAI5_9PROT|nr:HNH endonuclease [Rhodovibrio sodomensis]MBK1667390.1 hypothetical protein [Rhodovibrio sodomensis]
MTRTFGALALLAATLLLMSSPSASAHPGGLDAHGCHHDRQNGGYHCHRGPLSGHAFQSKQAMLRQLEGVSGGATTSGAPAPGGYQEYDRDLYRHWTDDDGDCQNVRHEVLIAESRVPVSLTADGCRVVTGEWHDPYTGRVFKRARDLDVDHVVPLAEAHRSGGYRWSAAQRERYANDMSAPEHLMAVELGANRSKGADDPARWLPENRAYRCAYVRTWVAIKQGWGLSMDPAERRAIAQVERTCANRGQ